MVEGEASLNVPYVPVSGNADPKLVVPSNIADAQRRAVQQLEREVGQTVDAYTAQEMGWTIPELYSRLSAAQIEAVGLFIRNANTRQTGLINSDQTGVGKGRVVATIIEWARKHNKVPIFITASKQLYSDMAGRDLPSIGNTSFRPFITDSDYIYLNGEGEEVSQKPGSRTQRETMLRAGQTGSLPPGSDGIFTTYYQLRGDKPPGWREEPRARARRKRLLRPRPDGPRLAMMRALAPNAIFILDEAHEAAGADSDTGLSLQSILRDAAGAMYASATFAKRPANLMLYALGTSLKLSRLNQQQLERLFTTGGIPLQQALTTMLAEEGEFVRREQNMKGVDFHFESATQNTAQEVEQADVYTSFLRDLFPLADQVNQAMAGIVDGINQDKPEEAQIDLANTNFGAKLFQLSNQYLFSLRADATARKAIEVLKAGQKPFIAVYNTMQGPIGDLQNRRLPLTFGGLLLRQMQKMLEVKVRDPLAPANPQLGLKRGQRLIVLTPEDLPDGGELYHRIEAQIRNTDFGGMPISPIDTIKTAIQRAGFSIGELTAREGEIDETGQEIVLRKREKIERNKILRAYNGDESQGPITHPLDALIVNGSASTGLSAHTDPKFKDQRQRHMIVAQPAPDINIFMQMLGRIMRFGQTKLPVYTILTTSLSAERRFMTMLRGKLSSLNANTSADTESGVTGELAPDIFNFIGDSIVAEVMQANPELAELALIDLPNFRVPESLDDYARKATGMFVLLPDADAARLWRDISEIYDARIQALDEAGENPLKANIDDLRARTLASAELEHGTGETVFAGPVILEKLSVSPTSKPYTYAEAKALATEQEATNDQRVDSWIQRHSQAVDARLEAMRAREMSDEQITRTNNALWATRDSVLDAQRMLGSVVEYTISGHRVALAVPISIELKDSSPGDFSAASRHRLVLATNGLRKRVTVPLSQLDNLERVAESPAEQFESERQLAGERYAVTGNLLKGLAAAYGMSAQGRPRVTIYSTSTGELKTGVLMPPGWTPERATRRVPVENREDFATAVNNREAVNSANGEIRIADRQLSVWSRSDFRHIWGDRRFNNFFEASPVEHAGVFRGTIQRSQVASLYDFLIEKGLSLVFPGQSTPIQFTEEDTQQSRSASRAGMPLADVQAHLEAQGHTETGLVRVIDDPNSDADAQVVFDQTTGELLRIELNAAKLSSTEQVDSRLRHEFSHIVWRDGGVAEVLEALTEKERQDISETVARLGYSPANVMEETGARQVEALVDAFRKRSWFGRLVARVHVWAHNHGFKLTRRAAELIAAEAVTKVNNDVRRSGIAEQLAKLPGARRVVVDGRRAVLVPPLQMRVAQSIVAYHGTGAEPFEQFSTQYIGTGEGAQVYGWGLYFAENKAVADDYAAKLGGERYKAGSEIITDTGNPIDGSLPKWIAAKYLALHLGDRFKALASAKLRNDFTKEVGEWIKDLPADTTEISGHTYIVSLNVEPDELLDWDKPLSEQSEKVRQAVQIAFEQSGIPNAANMKPDGNSVYVWISSAQGKGEPLSDRTLSQRASELLASLGIKGIRYLDQGSRGPDLTELRKNLQTARRELEGWEGPGVRNDPRVIAQQIDNWKTTIRQLEQTIAAVEAKPKTYNYVIFDENVIKITQRNGEPVSLQESVQQSRVEPGDEGVPPDEAETGTAGRVFDRAISEEFRRPTQFAGATGPLSPEARAEGGQFTARELENLGLPTVEFETENHSRMFTGDAWQPNEAAGQRLLERHVWLMDHAAELYPDDGTRAGVLGTWINSLRNILGTMAERRENGEPVTFSEALQNDLRGLVQGQARFWGQLLASLRGMSSSILWAVRNADAILRTMRNEAFGGQAVSQFLDIIREHFRETWTTEAVTRLVKETRLASRLQDIAQISEDDLVALVRQTLQTPGIRHVNEFGTIFSRLLGERLGVDPKNAAQKFNDAAGVRLKNALSRAKEGAWARMEKNLRRAINRRTPLWRRLDAILQDGDLDFEEAITRMARNEGWTVPTPEEIARLQALAEREIELRTLPKETLDKIAALPRAEQKAARAAEQRDLEAATDTERAELIKRMNVTWSRWTKPVSWRAYLPRALGGHPSLEVVQNNAQAINEWITANLLLKLGFFVRQSIDVGVQTLTHDPTRALATAMLTHKDEIARGVFTADFWADAGAALKTAFDLRARTLRHAFAGAKQGLRGKGVIKHSERISHRLDIFERMMQQADRLAEEGKTGQAFAVRLVTWVRSALLFSRALDMLSTTGAEYVEVAHRIRTAMKEQGKSRAEIDQQIDLVFGEMKTQYVEAYARAQQIFAALGIKEDKTDLDEAAGNIVRARAYTALRAIDSKSDNFQAVAEDVANTLGWNEREAAGVGGAVGGLLRKAQRGGESIGIPTAFVSAFGNAIAIGINRKLTWMGLGKLAQGGGENPWYRTELDREQRLAEGFIGAGVSAFMASLVMLGAIAVRGFWPKDDKEREKWRIEGRRPGTMEIPVGDGQFIPLSLSVGPLGLIAPALVSAGQLRQLFDDRAEKQATLDKDAAKRGVKPGKIDPVSAGDVIRVAGNALGASLVNARTVSGIVGAATDQGAIEPVKILASAISGVTPPLPAWQDLMRIAGVYMNPRLATLGDMLVPMPGSPARRVNVLGDPSGNFDQVQQIVQTLTGGTYPAPVNPKLAQKQPAYEALFHANWVPSPPIPSRGYVINGVYRPMSRSELQDYTEKRGTLFARELAPIARQVASASQQAAQKLVQDAFSRANDNALRQVGVNIEASVAPRAFAAAAPARTFETGGSRAAVPALATLAFGGMGGTLPDFAPATSRGGLRRGLRRGLRIRRPRALRGRRVRLTRTRLPRVRLTSRRRTSRRGLRTLRL